MNHSLFAKLHPSRAPKFDFVMAVHFNTALYVGLNKRQIRVRYIDDSDRRAIDRKTSGTSTKSLQAPAIV